MEILNKINSVRRKQDAKEAVNSGYVASSLVWGEIRSQQWWPGQIFDPADLSKEALRHYKEGKFLVAYFGNGTFAWNDVTQIRPFHLNFERMQSQSDSDTFCLAVDCALDEVFRRVEFGLTCSCLPENVYADIQSQIVENSGIYKKSRRRDAGDEHSSVECFVPSDLVSYVKEAAILPKKVINKVEMVKCEAQLTSFCRWKGYRKLPEFTYVRGLLDINANVTDMVGGDSYTAINSNTHRYHLVPPKFSITKDKGELQHKRRGRPKGTAGKKRKKISHSDNDELFILPDHLIVNGEAKSKVRLEAPTPENKIGTSICKSGKMKLDRFISTRDSFIIPIEGMNVANVLSPDVLLKQLTLTAADPLHDHKYSIPVFEFFSKFKNSICLDYHVSTEPDISVERNPIELIDKAIPEYKYRTPHSEHVEDSNSTEQIVRESAANKCFMDSPDESPSVLAEHLAREDLPISKTKLSDPETEDTNGNHSEGIPDIPCNQVTGNHKDKMLRTALLLRFSKQGHVPSATDLNKIFSCYGPLHESETKIMKRNLAKVVFKKHCDAEVAFSSTGKYSIFGSSLISYRLKYLIAKPRTVSSQCRKPRKKAAPVDEGNPT